MTFDNHPHDTDYDQSCEMCRRERAGKAAVASAIKRAPPVVKGAPTKIIARGGDYLKQRAAAAKAMKKNGLEIRRVRTRQHHGEIVREFIGQPIKKKGG